MRGLPDTVPEQCNELNAAQNEAQWHLRTTLDLPSVQGKRSKTIKLTVKAIIRVAIMETTKTIDVTIRVGSAIFYPGQHFASFEWGLP